MTLESTEFPLDANDSSVRRARPERFVPKRNLDVRVHLGLGDAAPAWGLLTQISSTGLTLACDALQVGLQTALQPGSKLPTLRLEAGALQLSCGGAVVVRWLRGEDGHAAHGAAVSFEAERPELIEALSSQLDSAPYINCELRTEQAGVYARRTHASDQYIDKFYARPSRDLFNKCNAFRTWVDDMRDRGLYQRLFRVTVTSSLNNQVTVFDPVQRRERTMVCFDSNSYLCLHEHPRVVERVQTVMRSVGYGSPSAQLLGGTHRYLRELECELSAFHGREDTIVFPTGFAANAGAISALIRKDDALLRDRLAHASIQDACRASAARFNRVFRHNDVASVERFLKKADDAGCDGKLVVTDGVFSMHGRIAPLPELVAVTKRYDAKLMVDDAHGVGVIGATGGGIEEHFAMPGSVDVMMGTLSKTIGALGGYVSGSSDLIYYMRFFAPSSMFTTATPAAWCAGMVEALKLIREEPQHHAALWRNIHHFVPALKAAGFIVPEPQSPIVTVFLGADALMYEFSRELFDLGIKCSSVAYPAVPKDESILRLVLTSKHTEQELSMTVERLEQLGRKYGILHRTPAEICAVGKRLISKSRAPESTTELSARP